MATLQSVRDQARAAVVAGEYPLALSLVELIRRHFPRDFETLGLAGQIQLAQGRRAEARDSFSTVLEVDPENVVARSGLALLAEEDRDLDQALEHLERAFALDSSNRQLAWEITRLHVLLSHTRPADAGFSQHAIARRFLREKRYERAIPLLEDALRRAPGAVDVAVGMAQALWLARRREQAEQVAASILADHPDCLKAMAMVAGLAFSRGDAGALSLLRKTAELDPGNSVSRRLFVEAGLPFPRVGEEPEIPERELWQVVGRLRPARKEEATPPEAVEEEWDEEPEEEPDPFLLPDAPEEGEWVRGKGPLGGDVGPVGWRDRWGTGDKLVAAGQLRLAVEQYLAVLNGWREALTGGSGALEDETIVVEKEKDGTYSGNRQT